MDITAIDAEINEQIQQLQDLNKQMGEIAQKIGALQEEGKALHSAGLQIKGAIEGLAKLKAKEEEKVKKAEADKAKGLILPDHSLVGADGKTVLIDANAAKVPEAAPSESAPAAEATPEAPAAAPERNEDGTVPNATILEVVK